MPDIILSSSAVSGAVMILSPRPIRVVLVRTQTITSSPTSANTDVLRSRRVFGQKLHLFSALT
jgi:hypothetical protein